MGPLVVLVLLGLHLWRDPAPMSELHLVLSVGLFGGVIDSVLGFLGVLQFHDSVLATWLCPAWLVAIWMIFSSTLRNSLGWLAGRYWIAAVLGGIFGPVSYYAGQKFGSLGLGGNVQFAVATLSVLWAVLMPVLVWWASVQTGETQ